ncbi:MAG: arginine--tRNA ligase [Bacteroidales bacterium]|jgi:arginyl-tRNA synthetase|nr:arginine--tRNA ligase [Bacteroidales bacterium]
MNIDIILTHALVTALHEVYEADIDSSSIQIQETRKEFEGDKTIVVFPYVKIARKSPEQTATEIGNYLQEHVSEIESFNVVKGFLNLSISPAYWIQNLQQSLSKGEQYGFTAVSSDSQTIMVEYSSPNTNKPLHLGHIRNNLLGYALAQILSANGYRVIKANLINDRGIHICKSMLAWKLFGNNETPESSGLKGDHLIGKYYVLFDKKHKKQIQELISQGSSEEHAKNDAPLMQAAREMLVKWESGDAETVSLWKTMNEWVYKGFNETYSRMGVSFDKMYYESQTYLLGKKIILDGLDKGILYKKEDGSVWADLTKEGLDHKLLLRPDGTSVYMTQDIGTAVERFREFGNMKELIYVVGNEQNYHFQVLSIILSKLGYEWAEKIYHMSYGMVELPAGKMKSREGTVVDADDLMEEMKETATTISNDLGKLESLTVNEKEQTFEMIAQAALKYFILKVEPRKTMMFNPKESIDFNGNTGPFIQYTHARICSVLRKADEQGITIPATFLVSTYSEKERELIKMIAKYQEIISLAGKEHAPSHIANYTYDLVKAFNQFYHECSILNEEDSAIQQFRLGLSKQVATIIASAMKLLGINVPERM